MILEMVASQSAGREKDQDLARLARVNKVIYAFVQPFLYRDFCLDHNLRLSLSKNKKDGPLVIAREHRQFIQTIRISFDRYRMGGPSDLALEKLLRSSNNLHTIRTRWNPTSLRPSADSPILKILVNSQPLLVHLELPQVDLGMQDIRLITTSLPRLETLVVNLPKLAFIPKFKPVFRLHRLVALELPEPRILPSLLSTSITSLTSLSLSLTSNSSLPSFASFSQLRSLSLWISTPERSIHVLLSDEADRAMITRMQDVLVSVKELPIKIVKIGSPISLQLYDVNETIFSNLPRSIESFTFGPKNDKNIHWRSLLPSKTSSPYPFLKHITMTRLPGSIRRTPGSFRGVQSTLKQLCLEAGIKLESLPVSHLPRFYAFILDSPRVLGGEYDAESAPDFKHVRLPYGLI